MPSNAKPDPPQQSSLHEMFKKGTSKGSTSDAKRTKDATPEPIEDVNSGLSPEVKKGGKNSSKRKSSPKDAEEDAGEKKETQSKVKRRRIVTSEDEDDVKPAAKVTEKKANASKADGKAKTKPKSVNDLMSSRSSKGVTVPQAAIENDSEEEEKPEADEQEDFMVSDGEESKAAHKVAQLALSRTVDVDVGGGWKKGQPVPYAALAHIFGMIEATTKRIEITTILTSFLLLVIKRSKDDDYESLRQAVYLCINRLCPDYQGLELGIGESLLIKAIAESTGRKVDAIKNDLKKEGDLGLVAINSRSNQKTLFKPQPLTLPGVFKNLTEIAKTAGNASQNKKVSIIIKLLAACTSSSSPEAKYIIRSLEGKLRIGLAERTLIVSLAHAVVLWEQEKVGKKGDKEDLAKRLEEGANIVKGVYSELPSYDHVIPALLKSGINGLRQECKLTPGIPLKPMLAKPTKAITEVLDRFEGKRFTCEYKYDGERAQVHMTEDGKVHVFSRNSEDMSAKYPDIFEQIPKAIKEGTTSFVLDAEAVAIDRTTMKLLPFQELSRRKRKDVKVEDIKVWVCLFGFDLLYLNGQPLLHKSLAERRELLRQHFVEVPGEFMFAKSSDGASTEEIQAFLEDSVKDSCEGLMVKMLETDASFYEPSRRSVNWLKLKKDYLSGVGDSFDLVVVGGFHGKGKRTAVYGAYLLACYDPEAEKFQTICKIGTGFSEEVLKSHSEQLKDLEIQSCRADVDAGGAKPDVWFEPKLVWEVLAADLSLSPIYTAAQGLVNDRGISLRFPRFLRVRDDKDASDATDSQQIAEAYERQSLATSKSKKGDVADDFW